MFKELRVSQIMPVGQYDAANSAPIPLTQLASGSSFKTVPIGRTPWPSSDDLKVLFDKAEQEGYAQGLQKAKDQVEGERRRDAVAVRHLLEGLTRPYEDINEQLLATLVELALQTGAALARRELTADPQALQAVITEALGALPQPEDAAELSLHPEDAALVEQQLKLELPGLTIVPDPSLQRGDCELRAGASTVDARLQTRLEKLLESTLGQSAPSRSTQDNPSQSQP